MKMVPRVKLVLTAGMVFLLTSWHGPLVLAKTTVRVLEQAQVRSKIVMWGEISKIKGEDGQLVEALKSVMLGKAPHLDGQYTIWGEVTEGMEFVDNIKKAEPGDRSGLVRDPDKIVRMRVASDVK